MVPTGGSNATVGEQPRLGDRMAPEAEGDVTIGMYHRKAGTRTAGGVAVFVQEAVAELAADRPTYLYTEAGDPTAAIAGSSVEVVPIRPYRGREAVSSLSARLPTDRHRIAPGLARSLSTFADAALNGVLDHVDEHVDVLFTHDLFDTLLVSNWVDTPVVRVFHGCQRVGLGSKLAPRLSKTASTVANSRQTARELVTELDHDVDWIVYPGVNVERFNPGVEPAIDRPETILLYVGRFVPEKGVYDLLTAYARVDAPVSTRLYLVGRGDVAPLRARIDELGLAGSVTIEEELDHDRLPRYYAAADVFCLPTRYESFGMVNLEAMACGTPVVTTDLPGIREYATDRENALLVQPGDTERLAERLSTLLSDSDLRDRLGASGRETARAYSWKHTAENLCRVAEQTVRDQMFSRSN